MKRRTGSSSNIRSRLWADAGAGRPLLPPLSRLLFLAAVVGDSQTPFDVCGARHQLRKSFPPGLTARAILDSFWTGWVAGILPNELVHSTRACMHPVYRIDVARRFVTLYWSEFPPMAQLRAVVEEAVADSEFKPGMNFLWDRKPGLANPASIEYLRDALYYLQMLAERVGAHSWAIVAHNPADFGRARMLEAMSEGTKVTIRAFKSSGDAEEWLRNPVRYEENIVDFPASGPSLMGPLFA